MRMVQKRISNLDCRLASHNLCWRLATSFVKTDGVPSSWWQWICYQSRKNLVAGQGVNFTTGIGVAKSTLSRDHKKNAICSLQKLKEQTGREIPACDAWAEKATHRMAAFAWGAMLTHNKAFNSCLLLVKHEYFGIEWTEWLWLHTLQSGSLCMSFCPQWLLSKSHWFFSRNKSPFSQPITTAIDEQLAIEDWRMSHLSLNERVRQHPSLELETGRKHFSSRETGHLQSTSHKTPFCHSMVGVYPAEVVEAAVHYSAWENRMSLVASSKSMKKQSAPRWGRFDESPHRETCGLMGRRGE